MKRVAIRILANAGYSKEQPKGVTLGDLKNFIEELIEYYDEDTEIVTRNDGNIYGAKYGQLYLDYDDPDEDEEEE